MSQQIESDFNEDTPDQKNEDKQTAQQIESDINEADQMEEDAKQLKSSEDEV